MIMRGTIINNLRLTKVVDGDTVKVMLDGEEASLRLACLDTEESWPGGTKPVTEAGRRASQWAKEWFGVDADGFPQGEVTVDIRFDTSDPVSVCKDKHRGNYGRLLCYVIKGGVNYNLEAVKQGWSPYFVKYGRSRLLHGEFTAAEQGAQADGIGIWDPSINAGGATRDYTRLIPWWHLRDSVVQGYREKGDDSGVLSVRLDYAAICRAAKNGEQMTVLCDLQGGVSKWAGGGALIYAGSIAHKFNLWIPDRESPAAVRILRLVSDRYAGQGRGYVYVTGMASRYPDNDNGKPQIVLTDAAQLSDLHP
jgi:micrococcal nuclease